MGSKIEYVDSSQIYAANYVRNSKAIGVLWGMFTICYAIINSVAFVTPEWLGDTSESDYPARFGLWNTCYFGTDFGGLDKNDNCRGNLNDIFSSHFSASQVASLCGIISVFLAVLTVLSLLLFFFCTSTRVYRICGWLQLLSALFVVATVIIYPFSWNSNDIRKTCGNTADRYYSGDCSIRWAYFLAVIGCLDAIVLATLAFILAVRHVKLQPEPTYGINSSLFKGEINNGYIGDTGSTAGSRKSLNLHPVLLMPQPMTEVDRFSEFSGRTGRSKTSMYRPDYSSNIQNFQL